MQAKFIQPWIKSDIDFSEQQKDIHELLKKKCHANIDKSVFISPDANVSKTNIYDGIEKFVNWYRDYYDL